MKKKTETKKTETQTNELKAGEKKLYYKKTNEIIVSPERQRKVFDEKSVKSLAASIFQLGQLQPGLCYKKDGEFHLIAGERRLRACAFLDRPFKFILTTMVEAAKLEQAQLEENLKRVDLTWQEEVTAKKKLYELVKEREKKTTIRSFAAYLNEGKSLFHEDLQLASWITDIKEIREAKTKTEAKKIVKRLTQTIKRKDKLEEKTEEIKEREEEREEKREENDCESQPPGENQAQDDAQSISDQDFKYYASHCLHSTFEEARTKLAPELFNLVFFDPPWGVDYVEARKEGGGHKHYKDGEDIFATQFQNWLSSLYSLMTKDSHLYCFFPITKHEFVYDCLETAGFQVNRMPLIWYKFGCHTTRNPYTWYGRSYEPIAFARKGNKPLLTPGASNVIMTMKAPKIIADVHPTSKHPDVYLELLKSSAEIGDKILDPMSGSGACALAAELIRKEKKLEWLMIEKEKEFNILQQSLLSEGYFNILTQSALAQNIEDKEKEKEKKEKI